MVSIETECTINNLLKSKVARLLTCGLLMAMLDCCDPKEKLSVTDDQKRAG